MLGVEGDCAGFGALDGSLAEAAPGVPSVGGGATPPKGGWLALEASEDPAAGGGLIPPIGSWSGLDTMGSGLARGGFSAGAGGSPSVDSMVPVPGSMLPGTKVPRESMLPMTIAMFSHD